MSERERGMAGGPGGGRGHVPEGDRRASNVDDRPIDRPIDRRTRAFADTGDGAEPPRRRAGVAVAERPPDALPARPSRRQAEADRRRRRRRTTAALVLLAVLILPFLVGGYWFYTRLDPSGSPGAKVTFTVEEGWGTGDVADALADAGVVKSAFVFKVWSGFTGGGPFPSGSYHLNRNLGVRDVITILEAGPPRQPDLSLLLPPGLRLDQIADRVAALPGRTKEKFLEVAGSGLIRSKYQPAEVTSLEGFLFPDTYFIGVQEDEAAIVRKLVARFDEIGDRIGLANATATNGLTPYQTIVSASLIQTEAKLAEDAPLISGVIVNRLKAKMPLQIDSTLCYAKGGCPPVPTNADKLIDSPYNTYKIAGLPPTPIASVTEASLEAAMSPAAVPYLYYVVIEANGKHKFATTLAEHNRNVAEARAKGLV